MADEITCNDSFKRRNIISIRIIHNKKTGTFLIFKYRLCILQAKRIQNIQKKKISIKKCSEFCLFDIL